MDPLINQLLDQLMPQPVMDDEPFDEQYEQHPWEREIADEFLPGQSFISDRPTYSRMVDISVVVPESSTGLSDGSYAIREYMSRIPPSRQWDEWKVYLSSAMVTLRVPIEVRNDVLEQIEYMVSNDILRMHMSYIATMLALLAIDKRVDQPLGQGLTRVYESWSEYAVKFHIFKEDIARYMIFVKTIFAS